jgi:Ca2+-binding RTX toxin-like protein
MHMTNVRRLAVVAGGGVAALTVVVGSAVGVAGSTIIGTGHGEDLNGTRGADLLLAYGGQDWIYAKAGADEAHGNKGDDYLYGGTGRDELRGGPGRDGFIPGSQVDRVFGGDHKDIVFLASDHRADKVHCGAGFDRVYGVTKRDKVAHDCEWVTSKHPSCRSLPTRLAPLAAEPARC